MYKCLLQKRSLPECIRGGAGRSGPAGKRWFAGRSPAVTLSLTPVSHQLWPQRHGREPRPRHSCRFPGAGKGLWEQGKSQPKLDFWAVGARAPRSREGGTASVRRGLRGPGKTAEGFHCRERFIGSVNVPFFSRRELRPREPDNHHFQSLVIQKYK